MTSHRSVSTAVKVSTPTKVAAKEKEPAETVLGTAEDSLVGIDSCELGRNHAYWAQLDFSPEEPMEGEKPNDLLQRLYEMWPHQLTASYRPHVPINSEATAESNLRYLRELYPSKPRRAFPKVRTAGVVVETVCHLGKKGVFLRSSGEPISLAAAVDKSRLCL